MNWQPTILDNQMLLIKQYSYSIFHFKLVRRWLPIWNSKTSISSSTKKKKKVHFLEQNHSLLMAWSVTIPWHIAFGRKTYTNLGKCWGHLSWQYNLLVSRSIWKSLEFGDLTRSKWTPREDFYRQNYCWTHIRAICLYII